MEFIIQNIGWFVGIGLVFLLALIGYLSEKRENSKLDTGIKNADDDFNKEIVAGSNSDFINKNVDNLSVGSVNKQNDLIDNKSEVIVEQSNSSFNDNFGIIQQQNNVSNIKPVIEEQNDFSVINDNQFRNIESINLSLEDLEKKNYNEILDSRMPSDYDYVDDDEFSDFINNNLNTENEIDDSLMDDINTGINHGDNTDVNNNVGVEVDFDNDHDTMGVNNNIADEINPDNTDIISDDVGLGGQNIDSSGNVNDVTELSDFNNYQTEQSDVVGAVPELSDNNYYGSNFENDSVSMVTDKSEDFYDDGADDDIWKF